MADIHAHDGFMETATARSSTTVPRSPNNALTATSDSFYLRYQGTGSTGLRKSAWETTMNDKTLSPAKTTDLHYWRDRELDDASLLKARYGTHTWERHVHEELVISVSEAGTGVCRTKGGAERSGPGTFWIFEPGETHSGFVDESWQYRGAYLGERSLAGLRAAFDIDSAPTLQIATGLYHDADLAKALLAAHRADGRGAPLLERQALWGTALGRLFTRYGKPRPTLADASVSERRLRLARDYLEAHFRENVSVDDLARLCAVSRFHFMRQFRLRYGITPHAYLVQLRVNHAKRLLTIGRMATDVAYESGFCDQSSLTSHFKRAFGVPPGTYAQFVAR